MSSNNGLDISHLLANYTPQHLITKLYQSVELGGVGPRYSVQHAKTARDNGCTVGGYGWLYAGIPGDHQVADFLETARKAGISFSERNPLWLDCEDYTDGSFPSLAVISQAVTACEQRDEPCGIYTGGWWWKRATGNSTGFAHLPLWDANYDDPPSLKAPGYGGWQARSGHQWTGNPVDRSIFNSAVATP